MISPSPGYVATQSRLQRTPIYKAKFASVEIPYSTHRILRSSSGEMGVEEWIDRDEFYALDEAKNYDTDLDFPHINQSVVGDLFLFQEGLASRSNTKPYADLFEGQQSQVLPEEGHASVGAISFVLTDVGGDVTALVMGGILGERVELYAGFDDIAEDEFLLFFTGIVAAIRTADTLAGYEFTVYSPQSLVNRQVFLVSQTTLAADMTATQTTMFVTGHPGDSFLVQVDDEIINWSGYDPETGNISFVVRGYLGTIPAEHRLGAEVRELIQFGPVHPIWILLILYTGSGKAGLGLPPSYIDMEAFSEAIQLIGSAYLMEFRITRPENAMEWAEREIYKVVGAYPVVKSDGKLSIVVFHAPTANEAVGTIDHRSIVHDGQRLMMQWSLGRDGSLGQIINDVTFLMDHDPTTDTFASSAQFFRPASINRFGRYPVVIEGRGLRTELENTLTLVAARALQILNRYENGAPLIQLTTHLQQELIEPGDIVALTSSLLPNRDTKTRGVTEALMEVVNRNVRFATGQVDFDLLWTSFSALNRDDFNRPNIAWYTDPALGSGGAWDAVAQSTEGIHIQSNQLFLGNQSDLIIPSGAGHGVMVRTQIVGANQSSQLTYRGVSGAGGFSGPAVRVSYTTSDVPERHLATLSGYAAIYDLAGISLRLYNGTDPAGFGEELARYPVVLVPGDTVRIEARGSNITVFVNDRLVINIIDTVQTTNQPGAISNYAGAEGGILWDDFVGGDSGWA